MKMFFILLFTVLFTLRAMAVRFDMRDAALRNSLLAISDAPFERTIAVTHFVSGFIEVDPASLAAGMTGKIDVDVRTLDFGGELKSQQVREPFLKVSEFPVATAVFQSTGQKGKLGDGQPLTLNIESEMTLRGITKRLNVPLELTYFKENETTRLRLSGNLLRVRAKFELETSPFGIMFSEALSKFFNRKVEIWLEAMGSDRLPTEYRAIQEGPKKK